MKLKAKKIENILTLIILARPKQLASRRPIPDVPNQFRVSEELSSNGVTSYIRDVIYSEPHQIIRYERRNTKKEGSSFFSLEPLISIHDYNIGVSFTINKVFRNCTITPISISTFDSKYNFSNSLANVEEAYVIRLKSPKAFFQLDSDYQFSTSENLNGIQSDIFTSEFFKNTSSGMTNIMNSFAFSSVCKYFLLN